MPTICVFQGITIRMHYNDHAPPHFHVHYGEFVALVHIDPVQVDKGDLPHKIFELVRRWAMQRKIELLDNWDRAGRHDALKRLAPLED